MIVHVIVGCQPYEGAEGELLRSKKTTTTTTIERIDQRYLLSKNTESGCYNTVINETG
ncbi:MAG: hypothetical protein WCF23_04660 [Candidatus Nitrosopolaris sp.]